MAAGARRGRLCVVSENSESEYTGSGPRGSWPGPEQGPVPARPALRRDRQSRIVAGVCGGLGRHLDVDPVIFRILFVLLTFFGGFGLLVYAVLWLFVPDENEDESEGHRLLRGGSGPMGAIAVLALIVVGFMVMFTVLDHNFWHAIPLLLLAAAIVAVLSWIGESGRRQPPQADVRNPGGWGPGGNWGLGGGPGQPQPWWQRPVQGSTAPPDAASSTPPAAETVGTVPGEPSDTASGFGPNAGFGASTGYGPSTGWNAGWDATSSRSSAKPSAGKPRRVGGLVLSGALLAIGVVGVLAEAGAINIGWSAGLALAVMAVGAGMVVGGLFGRARMLIPLGLVLAVPLIVASAIGVPLRGETGDLSWTPVSAAAVSSPYELAAGHGTLDLSSVDPNGGTVHVTAYVGAGQLIVTVPDNVAVIVTAHVGMGRMQFIDGSTHSGLDVTKTYSVVASGPSQGTIVLDLKAGAGDVEVQRAD